MSFSDHLPDLLLHKRNIRYSGVNCALGPSKSIRYRRDFVKARFVIVGFCYSAGLSNDLRYNGVFVIARFVIAGCHWGKNNKKKMNRVNKSERNFCPLLMRGTYINFQKKIKINTDTVETYNSVILWKTQTFRVYGPSSVWNMPKLTIDIG